MGSASAYTVEQRKRRPVLPSLSNNDRILHDSGYSNNRGGQLLQFAQGRVYLASGLLIPTRGASEGNSLCGPRLRFGLVCDHEQSELACRHPSSLPSTAYLTHLYRNATHEPPSYLACTVCCRFFACRCFAGLGRPCPEVPAVRPGDRRRQRSRGSSCSIGRTCGCWPRSRRPT